MLKTAHSLILILGFFLTQTVAAFPGAGFYTLISGTDHCPDEVELTDACDGFALYPRSKGVAMDTLKFCKINKGLRVEISVGRKILHETENYGHFIRKKETTLYIDKANSLSLIQEDTLIPDGNSRFLWEHNRNGQGHSCLYTK